MRFFFVSYLGWNYSTYDRELLAIFCDIQYFRHFLEGRQFGVYTDHTPLIHAFQQGHDRQSPRQIRQLEFIRQFSIDIRHVQGANNVVDDCLSRTKVDAVAAAVTIISLQLSKTCHHVIFFSSVLTDYE